MDFGICIKSVDIQDKYSIACMNSIKRFSPDHPPVYWNDISDLLDFDYVMTIPSTSLVLKPLQDYDFDPSFFKTDTMVKLSDVIGKNPDRYSILNYSETLLDSVKFLLDPKYKSISLELYDLFKELQHG